jgi:ABC-2 type transport system permease protein
MDDTAVGNVRRAIGAGAAAEERYSPLAQLTLARMREFVREPEAVFWVFIFPVLLALALGIAFRSKPPDKVRVGVDAGLPAAPEILRLLSSSPELAPVILPGPLALKKLRAGDIDLVVGSGGSGVQSSRQSGPLPSRLGTGEELPSRPEPSEALPSLSYHYDPTRNEGRLARLAVGDALEKALGRQDLVRVEEKAVVEKGARYIDFLIPGLIGLNLMASGMWGIGFNVVDSRTKKLLKLLTATPMRRSHFLLGFMFSRLSFLILEVLALVGFGWLVFGVTVQGSLLALAVVIFLGALTFLGLGLLVAARPRTVEAVSGWMNFVMLPMWLMSGSFFSYGRFPAVMQLPIRLLPLTALNDALRAIMNEGALLHTCWPELSVLVVWGLLSFTVALKIFRWQ